MIGAVFIFSAYLHDHMHMVAKSQSRMGLLVVRQVLSLNVYKGAVFQGCEQDSEVYLIDMLFIVGFLTLWNKLLDCSS